MEKFNSNTHIFLYAKGWYKKTDTIQDLKVILAERSGVESKYITIGDILTVLSEVIYPFINSYIFLNLCTSSYWHNTNIIDELLSILRFVEVTDLNLGIPDCKVLPLKEEDK